MHLGWKSDSELFALMRQELYTPVVGDVLDALGRYTSASPSATEWGPHGFCVNAIAPGWIASEMLEQALNRDPTRKTKILGRIPAGGFGEPDDIGWDATYLASPAAKYVSGALLPVDGGAAESFCTGQLKVEG